MAKLAGWLLVAGVVAATAAACGGGGNGSGPSADAGVGADGGHGSSGSGGGAHDGGNHFGDAGPSSDAGGNCSPTSQNAQGCQCTVGQTRACYTGPAATRGVGACQDGSQTCLQSSEFGTFGLCFGSVLPGPETCSSTTDTNCNGLVGCADPVACPGGCAHPEPQPEAGPPECRPPIVSNSGGERCPDGTVMNASGECCPCTASDCGTNNSCCSAKVCAGDPSCATCAGSTMPAICNGNVDLDCDDFDEDCDQLCCPCKPASCGTCPGNQVPCDDGTGNLVCTDVTSNDNQCGACDTVCSAPEHCVNGWCQ